MPEYRLRLVLLFAWFCCLGTPLVLLAQGTQADYDRAAGLRRRFAGKVFRDRIEPQWIDANHFWYRIATGPNSHEFVFVDAAAGKRKLLFDHARLAESLAKQAGGKFQSTALPLQDLNVQADQSSMQFRIGNKSYQCKLPECAIAPRKEMSDADKQKESTESLPILKELPSRSRSGSGESEIVFVNQTATDVRLYWRDFDGKRVSYGRVAAGQSKPQHTFAGHVWEVTDAAQQRLAGFVARANSAKAVITRDLQPQAPVRPAKRRDSRDSPDGRWSVRFENHNVVLRSLAATKGMQDSFPLTSKATADNAYGGRVYWSPDSRQFVVLQTRAPQRHPVSFVESTPKDQLQPRLHTFDYLKPGDRIAHPRPRLFDVAGKRAIPIDESLFPNPWRLSDLAWQPDSQGFRFLYNQRGHQVLRVIRVDKTGKATAIIDEKSSTFIDYNGKKYYRPLTDTDEILWMSERDGWNHLWLYDAKTGKAKQITKGPWVVRRVEHVDEQQRQIRFWVGGVHSGQDPYYQHLCRVNFDGSGFVALTAGDGTHDVTFSPDGQWFFDKYSRVDLPPVTELRRSSDGKLMCQLETADHSALLKTGWTPPERFVAKGRDGKTDIYGIIIRPLNFDAAKQYPVVEKIYAGPHSAYVPKAFDTLTRAREIAELGFIVVQIDGMGTNWRSKAFHNVCWQNLADAGYPDRIAWMKAAGKTRPWMDLDRVGVFGGSAGGQNAMRALIDHHDFYKVAVADCGCHDNRMDKIWWNELWMGYPVGPHYERSSNSVHAHRLQGNLLLIVGELDRNVDPASTMQVVSALQKADKDFDFVIVAGAGHGAAETRYGSRRRSDFLVRHLHGVEPRSQD